MKKKKKKKWHQIGYNYHFSCTSYISLHNLSKSRILIKCLVLFTLVSFTALALAKMAVILAKAVPWFYKQNGFKSNDPSCVALLMESEQVQELDGFSYCRWYLCW